MAIIDKPTDHFTTFLWTGDGTSPKSFTGVGFQADMMWSKIRTDGHQHNIVDTVRGVNQRLISTNLTNAEDTTCTHGHFDSLDSDGFTITGAGGYWNVNTNAKNYVGWLWKAGGTAVSNTDGTITSSVSANTDSGFSIVSYTGNATNGATVGHGLASVPTMLIGKDLSDGSSWGIWHKNLSGATYRLSFNTDAQSDDSFLFGGSGAVLPTSTVFTLGSGGGLNGVNANIVYCFAEKQGFSKFGSYTGNGSTDGTFVYTGFKPAFLITKKTSATAPWDMFDDTRNVINPVNSRLHPNASDTEFTNSAMNIDFVSNGFKIRTTDNELNTSGATYIYMAFAEQPFVTSTDNGSIPATAR